MRTLTTTSSKIIPDGYGYRVSCFSREFSLSGPENYCLASKKPVNVRLLHCDSAQHEILKSVHSSSSLKASQVNLGAAETQIQETYQSKTVNVRFQLQKECYFREHFFIVGDDPILGLWEPESAIPLNWSEGHVWTVDLDVAIEKSIEFKFILKGNIGEILWQSGPNRVLKTWETNNTIIVYEDWENAELQKIFEEESEIIISEMPMVAENLTDAQSEEDVVPNVNKGSHFISSDSDTEKKSNVGKLEENKPMAIVADNISYIREDSKVNWNSNVPNEKKIEDFNQSQAGLGSSVKGVDMANCEGGPVLVPGLTSLPIEKNEEVATDEEEEATANASVEATANASVKATEAKSHDLSEPNEKQELEGQTHQEEPRERLFSENEEKQVNGVEQRHFQLAKEENQWLEPKPLENAVLENGIHWGRRTLRKLLNSFGLL